MLMLGIYALSVPRMKMLLCYFGTVGICSYANCGGFLATVRAVERWMFVKRGQRREGKMAEDRERERNGNECFGLDKEMHPISLSWSHFYYFCPPTRIILPFIFMLSPFLLKIIYYHFQPAVAMAFSSLKCPTPCGAHLINQEKYKRGLD